VATGLWHVLAHYATLDIGKVALHAARSRLKVAWWQLQVRMPLFLGLIPWLLLKAQDTGELFFFMLGVVY
jgi:hypothetical protein